jgi:hypothetical protein
MARMRFAAHARGHRSSISALSKSYLLIETSACVVDGWVTKHRTALVQTSGDLHVQRMTRAEGSR